MISIDWPNKVIFVPKTFSSLVQSVPTEIRTLDLNAFRLALKDLEDNEEGIPWPNTHNHNTEVSLSGITFARVIEIINGYTITFEDGQYAINLAGANSNIADKVNVNQVSVRTANSAGMTSSPAIEYASFNGGVTLDAVNGTDSVIYPYGTPLYPCKTAINSAMIRATRGFNKVFLKSDLAITGLPDGQLYHLEVSGALGFRLLNATIDNSLVDHCTVKNLNISGTTKTGSHIKAIDCKVENAFNADLNAIDSTIIGGEYTFADLAHCIVEGDIKILAGGTFTGIGIVFEGDFTTIDMQGIPGAVISLDINSGYVLIKNSVAGCLAEFNIRGAEIELDSTCTGGDFYIEGYGTLFGDPVALGMNVKANHLISREYLPSDIWDETLASHLTIGSAGKALSTASSGGVDIQALVDGVWNADVKALTDKTGFEIAGTKKRLDDLNDISITDLSAPYINYSVNSAYNTVGYSLVSGTLISGTADDTKSVGTQTVFAPTAINPLEVIFSFELGTSRPSEVIFKGYYTGSGGTPSSRYANVYVYSFTDTSWQLLTDAGNRIANSTINLDRAYVLQQNHVSPAGQVLIKYTSSRADAADRLYIDLQLIAAVNAGITAGEFAEAVWTHDIRNRALDGTHTTSGYFLSRTAPTWGYITGMTGNEVIMSGGLFDASVGLYTGRTIQFHQSGELIYEIRKIVEHKAGGVLVLDKVPVIVTMDTYWHAYILPELNTNETDVANAVWNKPLTENTIIGTFGHYIQKKLLSVAKFIGLK